MSRIAILSLITSCFLLSCAKGGGSTPPVNSSTPTKSTPRPDSEGDTSGNSTGTSASASVDLKGFGIIREFGGTDTAAIFGLLSSGGALQITAVHGPAFLGGARSGQLDQAAMDHLFLRSVRPMSQEEKQNLVSRWSGAQVIYFEGYNGTLCANDEVQHEVSVSGTSSGKSFTSTFRFIALPNSNGDCTYHTFEVLTQD